MIYFEISDDDLKEIQHDRVYHPHPRIRQKMEALWLKNFGLQHQLICQILCITGNTLRSYFREYMTGGLDEVREIRFYRPKSKLADYEKSLKAYFNKYPFKSALEAADIIERMTGIRLNPKRVREFLKSLGFKRLKVGHLPAKADLDEQRDFLDREMMPRIEEAKKGDRAFFLSTRPIL